MGTETSKVNPNTNVIVSGGSSLVDDLFEFCQTCGMDRKTHEGDKDPSYQCVYFRAMTVDRSSTFFIDPCTCGKPRKFHDPWFKVFHSWTSQQTLDSHTNCTWVSPSKK